MKTLEERAIAAYYRRFGKNADQPSVEVYEKFVRLYNVNGELAKYQILANGKLRWV